jgi:glycerol-3-phosphate acyltransferase PlsX
VYAHHVLGIAKPKVGLLSNGEEESKGNDLTRDTNQLLKQIAFEYEGNIEGRDIFAGKVDVVVCDGFVGNIVLKLSEGLAEAVGSMLREEIQKSIFCKIGYLLARPAFSRFKKKVDYAEYGGAPLLGINGVGMICHGGSNVKAIKNAIHFASDYAAKAVNQRMAEKIQQNFTIYSQQRDASRDSSSS